MKNISLLLAITFAFGLLSCNKDNNSSGTVGQQQLLVGKWSLQHETFTAYVNGAKQGDTTINASTENISNIQFNKDGTYNSASLLVISSGTGNLSPGLQVSRDSVSGTYSFTGPTFNISPGVPGFNLDYYSFNSTSSIIGTTTGTAPVTTIISSSTQISQLSQTNLTIESKVSYNYTINASTSVNSFVQDCYFTR